MLQKKSKSSKVPTEAEWKQFLRLRNCVLWFYFFLTLTSCILSHPFFFPWTFLQTECNGFIFKIEQPFPIVVIGVYLISSFTTCCKCRAPANQHGRTLNELFPNFISVIHIWTLSLPTHLSAHISISLPSHVKLWSFFPAKFFGFQIESIIKVVPLACIIPSHPLILQLSLAKLVQKL